MKIQVNGTLVDTMATTIQEYLSEAGYKDKPVAVEHNGQLVSKAMYSDVVLTAADRLEIVAFVGGG